MVHQLRKPRVEETGPSMPRPNGDSPRGTTKRVQLRTRLVERTSLCPQSGARHAATLGPRMDHRSTIRLCNLHGLLHTSKVSGKILGQLQEIRKSARKVTRQVLQLHLSRRRL